MVTIAAKETKGIRGLYHTLKGSFVRDTMTLSFGTAIAQAVSAFSMPLLARLYTPDDFGALAVFSALSGILAMNLTLRYDTAILLPKQEKEAKAIVQLCLMLSCVIGLLLFMTTFLLPLEWQKKFGLACLGGWLPIAVLSGIGGALVFTGTAWLNRKVEYKNIATLRIIQSFITAIAGLCLGLMGISTGQLLGQVLGLIVVMIFLFTRMHDWVRDWQFSSIREAAHCHVAIPKFLFPSNLLDMVSQHLLPILLITLWYGQSEAGQFSLAWKVMVLPMTLIGGAIAQVFYQRISVEAYNGLERIRRRYIMITLTLLMLSLAPAILMFTYGESLFRFLFGEQWTVAGKISQWLALSMVMYFVFSPTSTIILVFKKQRISFVFSLFQLLYRTGAVLVSSDIMVYVFHLALFEILTVILFEGYVVYLLFCRKINSVAL